MNHIIKNTDGDLWCGNRVMMHTSSGPSLMIKLATCEHCLSELAKAVKDRQKQLKKDSKDASKAGGA